MPGLFSSGSTRWLLLVAMAGVVAFWALGPKGGSVKGGPNLQCLVHADCAKALRCYAVPKDDPFATYGRCVEPCLDDLQCPAGMHCSVTGKGKEQLLPVRSGLEPGERVCLTGVRDE